MSNIIKGLLILLGLVIYTSCKKPEEYSPVPEIMDTRHKVIDSITGLGTIKYVNFKVHVIDGDWDLGYMEGDTINDTSKIYLKQYNKAIIVLREILAAHYDDVLGDNALMLLAKIYDEYLNDKEKAKEYYLQLILDFPGSVYVSEARKKYRLLRGDNID